MANEQNLSDQEIVRREKVNKLIKLGLNLLVKDLKEPIYPANYEKSLVTRVMKNLIKPAIK